MSKYDPIYFHLRDFPPNGASVTLLPIEGTENPKTGKPVEFYVGATFCSKKDQFSRKEGRARSEFRAHLQDVIYRKGNLQTLRELAYSAARYYQKLIDKEGVSFYKQEFDFLETAINAINEFKNNL